LRWAVGFTAALLIAVVAVLVGRVSGEPTPHSAPTSPAGPTSGASSPTTAPTSSAGGSSGRSTVPSTSAPTSTTLAEPGGPPDLAALTPSSGQAGQSVTVTGSDFLSSSGRISAEVGGQTASVACPDQTTCTLVIPPAQGTTSAVPVTVTTDSGTSNPLPFTYG
jgi:hypothetical protein